MYAEFTSILTGLFSGNRGKAKLEAEVIKYDNTADLSEEYDRRRQDRLNYESMKFNKTLDYCFTK